MGKVDGQFVVILNVDQVADCTSLASKNMGSSANEAAALPMAA